MMPANPHEDDASEPLDGIWQNLWQSLCDGADDLQLLHVRLEVSLPSGKRVLVQDRDDSDHSTGRLCRRVTRFVLSDGTRGSVTYLAAMTQARHPFQNDAFRQLDHRVLLTLQSLDGPRRAAA